MTRIAPSILSADFMNLAAELDSICGADYIHFDVMDGHFVPNISFGLPVLKSLRAHTGGVLDVHLMISEPGRWVERFARAGADVITVHLEAERREEMSRTLSEISRLGKIAGLSVKPGTPAEELLPWLDRLGMVLVMAVEPGFGGQKFDPCALDKIRLLRREIDRRGLPCLVEVDGGINLQTAALCRQAGVDVLVAGSTVFRAPDRNAVIEKLRRAGEE